MAKEKISHKFEKLKPNLDMNTISIDGDIVSIDLYRKYDFGNQQKIFEIFFYGNLDFKLIKEEHIIDGVVQKTYKCDPAISPNMNEVYRYLKGEKIR